MFFSIIGKGISKKYPKEFEDLFFQHENNFLKLLMINLLYINNGIRALNNNLKEGIS